MEPDNDQRIREKLHAWETASYPLDKDRLWSTLTMSPPQRRRSSAVYYAAAALLLAGALVSYSIMQSARQQTQLRMMEIELAIVKASQSPIVSPLSVVEEPCSPDQPVPAVARVVRERAQKKSLVAKAVVAPHLVPVQESPPVAQQAEPVPAEIETVPTKILVDPAPKTLPRVIIGQQLAQPATQTIGHLRIKLFPREEVQAEKNSQPPVTLAGINN